MIKLLVGLGNPGKKYQHTRHNVGFMVIDELAKKLKLREYREECLSHLYRARIGGRDVLLAKPQTYMNNSGLAVINLLEEYSILPDEMIVVYDDLDLPLGRIRLRLEGSSGGHHGIESIIREVKTEKFPRLKVGIGRPKDKNQVVSYVLSPFSEDEQTLLYRVLERSRECLIRCVEFSPEDAMNFCNSPIV
ncbi:peptidyl-tRNA hydrolase [Hydrogenobacter thermophilus TK-6]|uniref:Peptidyl-tRNA hydrolase n=1 Tax=Hydrogenobacter thermophilus (strain DSM 6534 / IAM 12695 / TK-6) TaxID=608538 RepID=D3DFI1_HYDTT|nr:aminoacyl-tRNA hydrolase [Hydrogenobacter thermophilus]ADO44527.1 peptidyl-tRNA hydrolase [Hydrogenobacter thermophilus TK-6]BAI68583.1 peptidyl-tRNA hydrolase [Hydrogenobacter thermophilus TK-6]